MDSSTHSAHSTQAALPSTSQSQMVSWQSAFWAVAAIAINTCLQDCGKVCGTPKAFAPMIRTSPVFCLVDTLFVVVQVCFYSVGHGVKQAMQMVASDRNQVESESAKRTPTHLITKGLLWMVACLQLLKLYALRQVMWTQLFGTCSMASYIANAILNTFGGSPLGSDPDTLPIRSKRLARVIEPLAYLSAIVQLILLVWILEPVLSAIMWARPLLLVLPWACICMSLGQGLLNLLIILLVGIEATIILAPAFTMMLALNVKFRSNHYSGAELIAAPFKVDSALISIPISAALLVVAVFLRIWYPISPIQTAWSKLFGTFLDTMVEFVIQPSSYAAAMTVLALSACLIYITDHVLSSRFVAKRWALRWSSTMKDHAWVYTWFFMANSLCTLIWYMTVYDPEGTYKPSWTENLG